MVRILKKVFKFFFNVFKFLIFGPHAFEHDHHDHEPWEHSNSAETSAYKGGDDKQKENMPSKHDKSDSKEELLHIHGDTKSIKRLLLAVIITIAYMIVEFFIGRLLGA
jgi:hypothetical protein